MNLRWIKTVNFIIISICCTLFDCHGGDLGHNIGVLCDDESPCREPYICEYGRCRSECKLDIDCEDGACVQSEDDPDENVCTVEIETDCEDNGCPKGLYCAKDGICRSGCDDSDDCLKDQICQDHVCYSGLTTDKNENDAEEGGEYDSSAGETDSSGGTGGLNHIINEKDSEVQDSGSSFVIDGDDRFIGSDVSSDQTERIWDLAQDLLSNATSSSPSNPFPDSEGTPEVWRMMYASGRDFDPATYKDFPNSAFERDTCIRTCPSTKVTVSGYTLWDYGCVSPGGAIGINTDSSTINNPPCAPTQVLPSHKAFAHPGPSNLVMFAWQSPISGTVSIVGRFVDSDCSPGNVDGIIWRVDKGDVGSDANSVTNLALGSFANCGDATLPENMQSTVTIGDFIYFIVNPNANYYADLTQIDVTITNKTSLEL